MEHRDRGGCFTAALSLLFHPHTVHWKRSLMTHTLHLLVCQMSRIDFVICSQSLDHLQSSLTAVRLPEHGKSRNVFKVVHISRRNLRDKSAEFIFCVLNLLLLLKDKERHENSSAFLCSLVKRTTRASLHAETHLPLRVAFSLYRGDLRYLLLS